MPFPPAQQITSMRRTKIIILRGMIMVAAIICFATGCTTMPRKESPTFSGTFGGDTFGGHPVKITLVQDENTVTGRGLIKDRIFSLSAITSYHGPVILSFGDGTSSLAHITLSPDGNTVTIRGTGLSMVLDRGGEPIRAMSGPFAGSYKAMGPLPFSVILTQGGDLLAGTGFIEGKPIAVVGKVTEPNRATGAILFSDESQNRVKVVLSGDGRILTIHGFGGSIEMKRD